VNNDTISGRVLVRTARAHGRTVMPHDLREAERLARLFIEDGTDPWTAADRAAVLVLRVYALPSPRP